MRRFLASRSCLRPARCSSPLRGARQTPASTLMPGVTFEQQVELTPHGPVAYSVITAPRADRADDDRAGARRRHDHRAAGRP